MYIIYLEFNNKYKEEINEKDKSIIYNYMFIIYYWM